MTTLDVFRARPSDLDPALVDLTEILHSSVHAGASVGFILPFARSDARAFWENKVFRSVEAGGCEVFFAKQGQRVLGTVQLNLDLPPNQPHRGDVAKLLVHPDARRQGIARKLLMALEDDARSRNKRLLVLDTRSGDCAQPLYASLGFESAGEIPIYCRNPFTDTYESTTYMYKILA